MLVLAKPSPYAFHCTSLPQLHSNNSWCGTLSNIFFFLNQNRKHQIMSRALWMLLRKIINCWVMECCWWNQIGDNTRCCYWWWICLLCYREVILVNSFWPGIHHVWPPSHSHLPPFLNQLPSGFQEHLSPDMKIGVIEWHFCSLGMLCLDKLTEKRWCKGTYSTNAHCFINLGPIPLDFIGSSDEIAIEYLWIWKW